MVSDNHWMQQALMCAARARALDEVPVGAVLVVGDRLVAEGWNNPIGAHDPSAHAEIMALRHAGQVLGNYRFPDAVLYVTLEPCVMCMGAMIHARIERLAFGAFDPKTGAAGSVFNITAAGSHNHSIPVVGGVLESSCAAILRDFFQKRRTG